jgi:hypothetical protein
LSAMRRVVQHADISVSLRIFPLSPGNVAYLQLTLISAFVTLAVKLHCGGRRVRYERRDATEKDRT